MAGFRALFRRTSLASFSLFGTVTLKLVKQQMLKKKKYLLLSNDVEKDV
jgi:hypothetical protein